MRTSKNYCLRQQEEVTLIPHLQYFPKLDSGRYDIYWLQLLMFLTRLTRFMSPPRMKAHRVSSVQDERHNHCDSTHSFLIYFSLPSITLMLKLLNNEVETGPNVRRMQFIIFFSQFGYFHYYLTKFWTRKWVLWNQCNRKRSSVWLLDGTLFQTIVYE